MAKFPDKVVKFTSDGSVKSSRGMEPIKVAVRRVQYTDFSATASTTGTITGPLAALQDDILIFAVGIKVRDLFGDGAEGDISDLTVQYGDAADPNELFDVLDVYLDSNNVGWHVGFQGLGSAGTRLATGFYAESGIADILTFTATGADLDTLTSGALDLYVYYFSPEDPDA